MKIYRKEKGIPEPEEKPEENRMQNPARNDFSNPPPQPEANRRNEIRPAVSRSRREMFWKQDEGLDLDNGGSGIRNEKRLERKTAGTKTTGTATAGTMAGRMEAAGHGNGPDGGGSEPPAGTGGKIFQYVPLPPSDQNERKVCAFGAHFSSTGRSSTEERRPHQDTGRRECFRLRKN